MFGDRLGGMQMAERDIVHALECGRGHGFDTADRNGSFRTGGFSPDDERVRQQHRPGTPRRGVGADPGHRGVEDLLM